MIRAISHDLTPLKFKEQSTFIRKSKDTLVQCTAEFISAFRRLERYRKRAISRAKTILSNTSCV